MKVRPDAPASRRVQQFSLIHPLRSVGAALALGLLAAYSPRGHSLLDEPPKFSPYIVLGKDDPAVRGGEPSLQISKRGILWVTDIGSPAQIWKSEDEGSRWTTVALPVSIGGADRDAAEDDAGRLHVVDQSANGTDCVFYFRSPDGGKTFDIVRGTHGGGAWFDGQGDCADGKMGKVDRPWVLTWGQDNVYLVYGDEGGYTGVDYSGDGGRTFSHVTTSFPADPIYHSKGAAVDAADGTLYLFFQYETAFDPNVGRSRFHVLGAATSLDRGKTFSRTTVVHRGTHDVSAGGFPHGAVDTAGNVFVVWGDDSSGAVEIYMSVSADRGRTWSPPRKVSRELTVSIYPTIVASEAGRVAVAWYGTPDPAKLPNDAPNTLWYVYVAVSTNALEEQRVFEQVKVSEEPFHRNSICVHANVCEGVDTTTGERPAGHEVGIWDFFRMALDASGGLNLIWADTAHYKDISKNHFARQIPGDQTALKWGPDVRSPSWQRVPVMRHALLTSRLGAKPWPAALP